MYLNKKIAYFNCDFKDEFEALDFLANKFVEAGVAKNSFPNAVIKREEIYPTGILLENMSVAIPHTDKEHVIDNQIGFISFKKPIIFHDMVNKDSTLEVSCLFMLAMKEKQVEVIQNLMDIFCSSEKMSKLMEINNFDDFYKIVSSLDSSN